MAAGDSAGAEARRQLALADAHAAAAAEARAAAARYGIADVTEKATARALAPLAAIGYHLLADRQWPGSRRAQVDLVVVGPGGTGRDPTDGSPADPGGSWTCSENPDAS